METLTKKIKAWAVVARGRAIENWFGSLEIYRTRKDANAQRYTDCETVQPCTITLEQPKEKAKRGKG